MDRVMLQDTIVRRAGVTARQWHLETREVRCGSEGNKIEFLCRIKSKGGGTTEVLVQIGSQDFATLVGAMCEADRHSAMTTMAAALAREIAQQTGRDATLVQEARKSVVDLAQEKVWQASPGDNDVQKLICNGVKKLVEELSRKVKPKVKAAA
jgi:hypothetical protein